MRVIGLTGGIACGKSTVSRHVQEHERDSMRVIDCDAIAHMVCSKGWPAVAKIRQAFGQEVLVDPRCEDPAQMELDRKKLGETVFKDSIKLKKLVAITGPAISKEIAKQLFMHFCRGTAIVILDAPTLFESKALVPLCAAIIVVAAGEDNQVDRVVKRDGLTEELARDRIRSQLSTAEKVKRADYVIWNDASLAEFDENIKKTIALVKRQYGGFFSRILSLPGLTLVGLILYLSRS